MPGRKLSKKNESTLRAAMEAITSILSQLEGNEESDSDEAKEARGVLKEAANLGNWLEARIHLAFTEIADMMFGDGRLTRDERIALSGAIGEALAAFNGVIAQTVPGIYQRSPWADAPEVLTTVAESAIESDFVALVEKAVRRDGTIPVKIIEPGWGSSGYYPKEVLERDGPVVFPKGLKMYWNHPTSQEESTRPEGDLNALAAELISDARYADGPAGPGLYADAKVFEGYQGSVNDLAKHIGVSIRASGKAVQGEAEGRKGPIVQQLTAARSVDFVTEPGAGGKILDMFEAARPQMGQVHKEDEVDEKKFTEALAARDLEIARLKEGQLLRDAKDFVRETVAKATVPDVTKARLIESLSLNPPVKDGQLDREVFTTRINEAVTAEVKYLTEAAGYGSGRIEGMGSGGQGASFQEQKPEDVEARMAEAFQDLGFSEASAKSAAAGRGW